MANYFVYSHEAMPRTDLFMNRDYNPTNDYIAFNGIYIDPVPAKTWTRIPDRFKSLRHVDRTDKQGHPYHVFADEIVKANEVRMKPRGVLFFDHEPTPQEKLEAEAEAEKLNIAFRLAAIQEYESHVEDTKNLPGGKPPRCNTYVLECYKLLQMERPGSVEALRAQRQPGESAADRISIAIETAFDRLLAKMAAQQQPKEPVRTIR